MKKLLLVFTIFVFTCSAYSQGQANFATATVSTLPSASVANTLEYTVTDSLDGTCATGGGTIMLKCRSDGSVWQPNTTKIVYNGNRVKLVFDDTLHTGRLGNNGGGGNFTNLFFDDDNKTVFIGTTVPGLSLNFTDDEYVLGDGVGGGAKVDVLPTLGEVRITGTVKINNVPANGIFSGITASIGGGLLTAGSCASGTAGVTGATTSMAVVVTPTTYPGDGNYWLGYVSSTNIVTVKVCSVLTLTPTASTYKVRVIP